MDWVVPRKTIDQAHAIRRNMPTVSPRFSYAASDFPLAGYSSSLVAAQTVRFLEAHPKDPFALWVSFPDPHTPYEAPRQYTERFGPDRIKLPPWRKDEFSGTEVPQRNRVLWEMLDLDQDPIEDVYGVVGTYHAMVRFMDDEIGRILDALERLELKENTIVVFCADHGDFAGEHGMMAKGGVFYDCMVRVPLIVSWPGQVPCSVTDESMVNLIDVVPTLLQLQGLEAPASMHGTPLPTVTDATPRDAAFSEYGAGGPFFGLSDLEQFAKPYGRAAMMQSLQWREAEGRRKMVRTPTWKYVHDPLGDKDELYDLVNDPWELHNVMPDGANQDNANQDIVNQLRLKLADWSIHTEDAHAVALPELAS